MVKLNEKGSLLIPLVVTGTLLLFCLVFAFWAFVGRQDYKNNVDAKIEEAVAVAKDQQKIELEAQFAEDEKIPNRTYQGPTTFGTLNITYPKTWSVYIDERGSGGTPLKGYMHPNYVPVDEPDKTFAFRFEVVEQDIDQVVKSFDSSVKTGRVKVSPYRAPKVEGELGSRIVGEISTKKQGDMVVLPLRDKTIKVWTEGSEFRGDFNTILETLTYIP